VEKHENHEIEAEPVKIGGGNADGAVPSRFFNFSNITNRHHDEEGVVHLYTMGFVAVS
jgi:hypothetical protein